ncbi:HK97 family phage prohead protease [Cellulomonas soli]|uniref:HK97 family phage prohead protease n=1 Tax=Cellulomonas soli TaxID=931535 RepID=UPI003F857E15
MTTTLTRNVVQAAGACTVLEHRTRALADTDARLVRAVDDGEQDARRFVGHAAVFNSRTAIGDPLRWGWYEEIEPGAFDKTLSEGDARFLVDHDSRLLVARKSAGDLRLSTDGTGLAVDADLDTELSYVRDLVRNLDKRRITGMSFGFYVVRDRWEELEVDVEIDGQTEQRTVWLRTIVEVRLLEVSAVTFPAYEDTDANVRAQAIEVRAARGIPTDTPSSAEGTRPAPAIDATRDDTSDPAPAQTTRGVARQDERAHALAIRYGLPRS